MPLRGQSLLKKYTGEISIPSREVGHIQLIVGDRMNYKGKAVHPRRMKMFKLCPTVPLIHADWLDLSENPLSIYSTNRKILNKCRHGIFCRGICAWYIYLDPGLNRPTTLRYTQEFESVWHNSFPTSPQSLWRKRSS